MAVGRLKLRLSASSERENLSPALLWVRAMYSVDQVRRGIAHPQLFLRELNALYHTRLGTRAYNTDGVNVFDEDWDTLLLLDACRYDVFVTTSSLPGELSRVTSRGSNTVEFLRGNVAGRDLRDTVYVTANPQYRRYQDELEAEFHAVYDVWRTDGWDDEFNTVLPGTTTDRALDAAERHPNKRILVHYIQPHYPFLDPDTTFDKRHLHNEGGETIDFWHEIMFDQLDVDAGEVWRLYQRSLARSLPEVERFVNRVEGKHVVTSDHGNVVGERAWPVPIREWGHPESTYIDELVTVPWLVHRNGRRRSVVAEETVESEPRAADDVVDERLRQLGYVE